MRKIAIVRRNGLGDLLCAYPMVLYLKKYYPEDKITLFVDAHNAPLLKYLPHVDEVVIFPKKGNKYYKHLKLALKHRKDHFDLAISAKSSPMKLMNFFLFALGAKERVAYVDKGDWHHHFINKPIFYNPLKSEQTHQALKCLQLLNPDFQAVPEELYPQINLPQNSFSLPIHLNHPVILLSATTTRKENRLDEARYASIVNRLYEEYAFSVVIVGQKEDYIRANLIKEKIQAPHALYFPRDFDEFLAILNVGDLFFVGDGGIGHIGASLRKKGVILFGQTDPQEWHPLSKDMVAIYHPHNVNFLSDEKILNVLEQKFKEVSLCKRS